MSNFKKLVNAVVDNVNKKNGNSVYVKFGVSTDGKPAAILRSYTRKNLGVISDNDGRYMVKTANESKSFSYITEAVDFMLEQMKEEFSVYRFFQPNPREGSGCTIGDCAIRALCCALDLSWVDAFDMLCAQARAFYTLPNSLEDTLKPFLLSKGYEYVGTKDRPKAVDFAKKHKNGTYVLFVQSGYGTHCLTLKDGCLYDAWCSIDKCLYGYFVKK